MNVLTFTAKSDFARFRVPYTTTSALTYSLAHPIAIKGMIGAIMGIDYNELFEYTKDMKIGIQVLNPVLKDTQSFNLVPQTGGNGSATFPSRVEFLRSVKYRVFLVDEEEKINAIKDTLEKRNFQFTPYLGASEHIAKVDFEGVYEGIKIEGDTTCHTVVPKDILKEIMENQELNFDRIPTQNAKSREYTRYEKVVFSTGSLVSCNKSNIYKVGDFNVYFF